VAAALEVRGLRKSFGAVVALDDVSFSIAPGEIFGYLGPNGAGKSTTLRVIADLVRPDSGDVLLLGTSHRRASSRQAIGFLPGELKLYANMTGRDLLDLFARFRRDRPPALRARLLDALQLPEAALSRRIKVLSHGTKQKIGVVAAMQHDPDLLLLDEPTLGLDPLVQQAFREVLLDFASQGRAVLFSSHILSEVEAICGRVAILRGGRIVAQETMENLRANMVRRLHVRFRSAPPPGLEKTAGVIQASIDDRAAELLVRGDVNPIVRLLASADIEHLAFPEPELEDIFLTYYRGQEAKDA
jgi:ABC-2 type transport system ATP-binding protein